MKRIFSKTAVVFVFLTLALVACSSKQGTVADKKEPLPKWKEEVHELDHEIDRLVNQRNMHLAKATRYQNQGDRLQFNRNNLLDARIAWQQAEINREIAERIQKEIDILEGKRTDILKAHGVKNPKKRSEIDPEHPQ